MRAVLISLLSCAMLSSNSYALAQAKTTQANTAKTITRPQVQQAAAAEKPMVAADPVEFDRLRTEGNDLLYNLDYQTARDRYLRMTKMAPDHPAGYVYLANNLWLETLNASRRLTTSVYTSGSFYVQDAEEDEVNRKREREFNELIKQALAVTKARLDRNPQDVEALYYSAAAQGLRAGYSVSVKRSFRKAIGDANGSIKIQKRVIKLDPNYTDAYLSIGLYEYVIDSLPFFWRTLARLAGLSGSKKRGIEHLEMVAERGKYAADDARVLLIGIYGREGKPDRALELISYLANKYPRNYLFGVERAAMLYKMNRADEGNNAFADMLKDERIAQAATDLINYQWAENLTAKGDYAAAIERYTSVKRWQKSEPGLVSLAHLHAGQALDMLGKREEAVAEYQIVLRREKIFDSHKLAAQYVKKPYNGTKG
jgi:tetratricopeptide (TPR) repeat protein